MLTVGAISTTLDTLVTMASLCPPGLRLFRAAAEKDAEIDPKPLRQRL